MKKNIKICAGCFYWDAGKCFGRPAIAKQSGMGKACGNYVFKNRKEK